MKKRNILFALPFSLFMLGACGGDGTDPLNNDPIADDQKQPKKMCMMKTMSFELGTSKRVMFFEYKKGKLSTVKTDIEGKESQTMVYNFNKSGNLQSFLSGSTIANYVYNGKDQLISIDEERGLSTRTFEYNDEGQISRQVTVFGGKPYTTHIYEYDADGQPIKVTILDKSYEETEVNEITYDDKSNPFKNKGGMVNSMELVLGYPVGNQDHNVITIKKTYKKKTAYQVNGKYMNPGDVVVNQISYEYNENGYPTSMHRKRGNKERELVIAYTCE
ncbi:MAG: hypothetical protein JKY09_02715 [Crocinitomicaceae bacterium]|nr:hypothetical protein [Crocinitomicaceae bacterium]